MAQNLKNSNYLRQLQQRIMSEFESFPNDLLESILVRSGNPNIFVISKSIKCVLDDGFKNDKDRHIKWAFLHSKYGFNRLFYTLWYYYHGTKVLDKYKKEYIQKECLVKLPDDLINDDAILKHVGVFFESVTNFIGEDYESTILLIYAMKFKQYDAVRKILKNAISSGKKMILDYTDHELQMQIAADKKIKSTYTTCDLFYSKRYPLQIAAADDHYTLEDLHNMILVGASIDLVFKSTIIDWSFDIQDYHCKKCLDRFVMLGADLHKRDMVHDLYTYIREDTGDELTAIDQFRYLVEIGANPTLLLNALLECKPYCEGPQNVHRCETSMLLSMGANINYNNGQWLMTYMVDPWERIHFLESGMLTTLDNLIKYYRLDVNILQGMALNIAVSMFMQLGSYVEKHKTVVRDWNEETDRSRILLRAIQALLSKTENHIIQCVYHYLVDVKCSHPAQNINKQVLLYVFKHAI